MGYICKFNGIYSVKLLDILSKTFGICWAKTIDNFMGCIGQKLWDVLQNYGIYWSIGYIMQNYGMS